MKLHERLAWIRKLECTATIKVVLMALSCHADKDGKCWPSQVLLARESGLGLRTIVKVIAELQRVGVLAINHRYNRSSVYVLLFDSAPHALQWCTWCRLNCSRTSPRKQPKPQRTAYNRSTGPYVRSKAATRALWQVLDGKATTKGER